MSFCFFRAGKSVLAALVALSFLSCVDARTPVASSQTPAPVTSNTSREPAPPSVLIDTTLPQTGGRTVEVKAGAGAFQAALEAAKPGDVISLKAGATYEGNFNLPKKAGSNWIIIRTSAGDDQLPTPGTRISPRYAPALPKLVSPNADPVISTAPGANHYRFVGVEFATAPSWAQNHGLIVFGDGAQASPDAIPRDLIIDRCYIHGDKNVNLKRAVALNSASTAIIDSYISDVHEVGADSQAICGWNGPGPFKIVNNYLEGAGENVMFGGADPKVPNLVPSDIEFRSNHCSKPLTWMTQDPSYAGKHWSIKNLFELKNARRVMIDGNLFENNWVDGQSGFGVLFTVRNQDGTAPWSVVEDVTFTNNILRHSAAGINFLGRDDNHPSEQVKRVLVKNNLFEDIGGKRWGNNGRFVQIVETVNVTIDHNTAFHTGNIVTAYGTPNTNFVFTNNIAPHNEYGVMGDGSSVGNPTIQRYFPGGVFKKNVIIGGRNNSYPAENFFPASIEFADRNNGDYRIKTANYHNAATDQKDIGCDVAALKTAIAAGNNEQVNTARTK
jgi:hypothetical protein